ncbi:hypothetical protein [Streptomyces lushanensis]|uniref:hypothetical protein n=1 Tax=Streptomyces lushanensis TaxID=1434255 RepID=UPI000831EA0F|nr:hypothetical protein [Streptomyces lushanensis]
MGERTESTWSGWRDRVVQVPGGGSGTPLLLEIRGGVTSSFDIVAVRAGAYHQRARARIATIHGHRPCRIVLPADCDAFEVQRIR